MHNLIKFLPCGTNLPFVPPEHAVDWNKMPPARKRQAEEEADKKLGLCDLSRDVKQHIASYLPLFEVEDNLRFACRDTFWNFQKPPPDNLEYDFVYFLVSKERSRFQEERHGVAHTTNDVLVAIWNHDWEMEEISITLKFVKFDRNHAIVPLFHWIYGSIEQRGRLDPLGCHYCGVQQASHVELKSSSIFLTRCDYRYQEMYGADPCAVFRHCRDWTPREPRIQLRHIGARKRPWGECGECGQVEFRCRCARSFVHSDRVGGDGFHIYYSPEWFQNKDDFALTAPSDSPDKSVILFSESFYWRNTH